MVNLIALLGPFAGVAEYFPHGGKGCLLPAVFLVRDEENEGRGEAQPKQEEESFAREEATPALRVSFFRRGVHAVAQVAKIFRARKP